MFTLVTLDNQTLLIVKKEAIDPGKILPNTSPFEVYGFIYKQLDDQGNCCLSFITQSEEVHKEQSNLIELARHVEPLFKGL